MQRLKNITFTFVVIIFFFLAFLYKGTIAGRDPWANENLKITFLYIIGIVPIFIIAGYFIEKIKERRKNPKKNA